MKCYLMIFIMSLAILFSGCGDNDANNKSNISSPTPNKIQNQSKNAVPKKTATPNKTATPKPQIKTTQSPKVTPAPIPTKFNLESLNLLNNKRLSWGLVLNKEHRTPGISESTKNLINKYNAIFTGDTSKKEIYLTFDEGYENGYTKDILETLKKNDVKSIFFITGSYLKENPELVKKMLEDGHKVGNHTISHPSLPSLNYTKLENEIYGLEKQFKEKFNSSFKYIRPPKGEYSERTLEAAKELGYKTVFWSFAYDDYNVNNQRGAKYAHDKIMDNLHNGAIILLHAVSKDNKDVLDGLIKDIREKGYTISAFDL